jgi:DNA mismatch endonuclease, patch repair protein
MVRRTADLVFRKAKVAVFVDGCFWHGCPEHHAHPKVNAEYWKTKITRNKARDKETTLELRKAGWIVLRFWSHVAPERAAAQILAAVRPDHTHVIRSLSTTEFKSKKRSVKDFDAF